MPWHTGGVRFSTEHHFRAPAPVVVERLADPAFHLGLTLPDLGPAELLEHLAEGDSVLLRFRYHYTGQLDPRARRLLGGRHLTWVQELRIDRAESAGSLHMEAEANPSGLHARATFTVRSDDVGGAVRELHGNLVVGIPVIGPMAERRIVPGVVSRLDVEAAELDRQTATGGRTRRRGRATRD